MKHRLASLTLATLFALSAPAAAHDPHADDRRTLSVNGHGEVSIEPDLVIVTVAVETTNEQANQAVAENAERSTAVAKAIKKLIGSDDQVGTTGYSLQPRYEHHKDAHGQAPRITGYVVSNQVRVETHAIDRVGKVVDAAIGAGANRISSLQFTLESFEASHRSALSLAGKNAREEAKTIAAALGVKLGPIVNVTSNRGGPVLPRRMEAMGMAARAMPSTPIEAGDVTVSADIHVVWEIE